MTKTLQTLAAALLVAMSVGASMMPSTAQAQAEALTTKKIQITQVIQFDGGVIVRHVSNNGQALKIEDMSTISDAKLQKLQAAGDTHGSIVVVCRGNVIVDIL